MSGPRCPVCGGVWTAPERLVLLGRIAVAERGAVRLSRSHIELLACLLARPLPRAELAAMFGGDETAARERVRWLNGHLKTIGWRVRRLTTSGAGEVWTPTEILRNEAGRLASSEPIQEEH